MRMWIVGIGMLLVMATATWYIWRRLVKGTQLKGRWRLAATIALVLFGLGGPVGITANRLLGRSDTLAAVQYAGFLLMAVGSTLISLLLIRDLSLLLFKGFERLRRSRGEVGRQAQDEATSPQRRQFLVNASAAGVAIGAMGGTGIGIWTAKSGPRLTEFDIEIKDLHPALDGLTIAQISDTHVGPTVTGEDLQELVDKVNALNADIITITGDLVDGFVPELRPEVAPLSQLRAPLGVYYCTGNHEYYWDGPGWAAEVSRLGVRALINEHEVVEHQGAKILIAGVTDYRAGRSAPGHESDPAKAMAGAPEADFKLMLAHQPKSIHEVAKLGVDLQVCGHTHGGQFFPYNLVMPFIETYVKGLYLHENTWIHVSPGAGYWGPPMRLGVPSEYHRLTLKRV